MNVKAAYRYQLSEFKKSVMIYYLVVALIIIFFGTMVSFNDSQFNSTGGIEMSSAIFLFVLGLNSFKETFLMLLQNGVSRKTLFLGKLVSAAILCTGMMAIDRILVAIITGLTNGNNTFRVMGLYEEFFLERTKELSPLIKTLEGLLFTICCYIVAFSIGYLITTAYYRMNKAAKIAVSVGLPVTLFFILPVVDSTITNGKISKFIAFMFGTVLGLRKDQPYNFIAASLVAAVLFLAISWLLIRKAVDKR